MEVLIGFVWVMLGNFAMFGGASFVLVGLPYMLLYGFPALIVRVRLHGFEPIRREIEDLSKEEWDKAIKTGEMPPHVEGALKDRLELTLSVNELSNAVEKFAESYKKSIAETEVEDAKKEYRLEREKRKAQLRKDYGFTNDEDIERILNMMDEAETRKGGSK